MFAAVLVVVMTGAGAAFAWDEPHDQPIVTAGGSPNHGTSLGVPCVFCHRASSTADINWKCNVCHSQGTLDAAVVGKGPHGVYSNASDRCDACHTVHKAADGIKLLAAQTVTDSCYVCHDGTGGSGVYGVLASRGASAAASHSIDSTNVVPGGNGTTGGAQAMSFAGGAGGTLGCSDCHSPHDANTVAVWTNQRMRTGNDILGMFGISTNRLLRKNPGGSTATATVYGSDWCLACHAGRGSGGAVHNHPVDSKLSTSTPFYYESVSRLNAENTTTGVTTLGTLAKTNTGFLIPWPRTAQQGDHLPICQQCHENSRNLSQGGVGALDAAGNLGKATPYSVTATDGAVSTNNPQFQNFPHETANPNMLVETYDNLCLNCHPLGQLP